VSRRRASDAGQGAQRVLNLKKDREVHHGEEVKGEETIDEKEEEGRSGSQEAQNDQGVGEAFDQEEVGAQSRPEAPLGGEAGSSVDACRRTGPDALVEPAQRLRRRWRRQRLRAIEQRKRRRRRAPPPALHSPVGLNSILYEYWSVRLEEVRYAGDL
jgi:hypothetical protein